MGNKATEGGKILGVTWDEKNDKLLLIVNDLFGCVKNVNPTKRNVLKAIASIYDPVGYIQPLVIKLKLMFQEICSLHIGWDDYIGKELGKKWTVIVKEMENFNEIAIPRCYFTSDVNDPIIKHYLHGFSDSSTAGSVCSMCLHKKCFSK